MFNLPWKLLLLVTWGQTSGPTGETMSWQFTEASRTLIDTYIHIYTYICIYETANKETLQTGIFRVEFEGEGGEIRFFYMSGHPHWCWWRVWHDLCWWCLGIICRGRWHPWAWRSVVREAIKCWPLHWYSLAEILKPLNFLASISVWLWHFPADKQHVGAESLLGEKEAHSHAEEPLLNRVVAQWCRACFPWRLAQDRDLLSFSEVGIHRFITASFSYS